MRKDSIAPGAYQKALELYQFSEKGFHGTGVDADDVPVLAPQVSKLKKTSPGSPTLPSTVTSQSVVVPPLSTTVKRTFEAVLPFVIWFTSLLQ